MERVLVKFLSICSIMLHPPSHIDVDLVNHISWVAQNPQIDLIIDEQGMNQQDIEDF